MSLKSSGAIDSLIIKKDIWEALKNPNTKIKNTNVNVQAVCVAMVGNITNKVSLKNWPIKQINPPIQKALNKLGHG